MPPGGGQMPMTSSGSQTGYNGPQQSMSGYPRPQMNQQINQMPQGKGRAGIFLKTSKKWIHFWFDFLTMLSATVLLKSSVHL